MGWLADFFKLLGGLLYWNALKSLYRLNNTRGRCPCQHPSDSGKAWETACAAITHWHDPARFRRVCPLLKKDSQDRWRCSVNRTEVRPFWRRALAYYSIGLVAFYLFCTLAAFSTFRIAGYHVTYPGVLWPPAWKKIGAVKSDFFLAKFHQAFAAHDMRAAMLDLSLAYDLNPSDYNTGLLLARFSQISQPGLADRIYNRLLDEHPGLAETTAQAFFRALLARGDFPAVQGLAHHRIFAAPALAAPWINAFLFANQRINDTPALLATARDPRLAQLPADLRTVLTLAAALRTATPADSRQLLITSAGPGTTGYALYFICRRLIDCGAAETALGLLTQTNTGLGDRDLATLRLDALAAQGWTSARSRQVELLLSSPLSPAAVELVATHLIRYPDQALLNTLFDRLHQDFLPPTDKSYAAYLSAFCAAGVLRDQARLSWCSARMRDLIGADFAGLDSVGQFLLSKNQPGHLENYLPALQPLSLETTYALLLRYSPAPAPSVRLPE